MGSIKQADTDNKKRKTAVALSYEKGDHAPKILASGVGEVAEKVGMPDIKHFSKCFKKIIGHSPSEFIFLRW